MNTSELNVDSKEFLDALVHAVLSIVTKEYPDGATVSGLHFALGMGVQMPTEAVDELLAMLEAMELITVRDDKVFPHDTVIAESEAEFEKRFNVDRKNADEMKALNEMLGDFTHSLMTSLQNLDPLGITVNAFYIALAEMDIERETARLVLEALKEANFVRVENDTLYVHREFAQMQNAHLN